MSAPVLSIPTSGNLAWVFTDFDPFDWSVDQSADGVSGWSEYDTAGGTDRTYPGISTGYYRVWGRDSMAVQITPFSNVVFQA